MKQFLIFLTVFSCLFLISIYPSFISMPGIDCLAGCNIGRGFPLAHTITHTGGIAGVPARTELLQNALLIDLAILISLSLLVTAGISYVLTKRTTNSH